jgi:hypothetical protein
MTKGLGDLDLSRQLPLSQAHSDESEKKGIGQSDTIENLMPAKDDAIAITVLEPKSGIDGGVCAVGVRIGDVKERGVGAGIHTIRDDSRGRIYQKNRSRFSSNRRVETSKKHGDFGGMSGGLKL